MMGSSGERAGSGGRGCVTSPGGIVAVLLMIWLGALMAFSLVGSCFRSLGMREFDRRAACLNNLNELGTALSQWQHDHDGKLPHMHNSAFFSAAGEEARSWAQLWPAYVADPTLYWCPSDWTRERPREGKNYGYAASNCSDWTPGRRNIASVRRGFFWHDHYNLTCWRGSSAGSETGSYECDEWKHACRAAGLAAADDVSYAFVGQAAISKEEEAQAWNVRIAGDNEQEGDEEPWITNTGLAWADGASWKARKGSQLYMAGYVDPGYRYVGGLEKADNHGQDGVNVLYLDFHAWWDGRTWPSPLGTVYYEWDGWPRCEWHTTLTGESGEGIPERPGRNNEGLRCEDPKPTWCNIMGKDGWLVKPNCPWE